MKKNFFKIATIAMAALFTVCACNKENNGNGGNGGLKDDEDEDISSLHASLQGSEYVTIARDEYSTAALGKRIKASYQVDDANVFLYVWENTYAAGTASGLNFYGEAAGWTSLVVGTVGWSGAGWCVVNPATVPAFVDSASDLSKWKFHIAYKGAANVAHIVILYWADQVYKFAVGQGSLEDAGVAYNAIAPVSGTFTPGVWNEYEISLDQTGMDYTKPTTGNLAAILSGGVTGTAIDVDAIFFYKK